MTVPADLLAGFSAVFAQYPTGRLSAEVERLIANYRSTIPTDQPLLRNKADVIAYAAYRMPATYAAVRAVLEQCRLLTADWSPRTHVDVGGGTGAAVWAAAETWPGVHKTTVVDWSASALDLGRELAASAQHAAVRNARWQRQVMGVNAELPQADLITVSYVLNELSETARDILVRDVAASGQMVVIVEPGTPAGYQRIVAARQQLVAAGLNIVAPCPHSAVCPLAVLDDWCHFAARLNRSAMHRQLKGAALSYEDEKFSYIVASRTAHGSARNRIVRRPNKAQKGMVELTLCTATGGVAQEKVTKRHGADYKKARDAAWGDPWPPVGNEDCS